MKRRLSIALLVVFLPLFFSSPGIASDGNPINKKNRDFKRYFFPSDLNFTTKFPVDPLIHFVLRVLERFEMPPRAYSATSTLSPATQRGSSRPMQTHIPHRFQTAGFPGQRLPAC